MNLKITWTDPTTGESGEVRQIHVGETNRTAQTVREAALKDACKVMCMYCAEGREVARHLGNWIHVPTPSKREEVCGASDLWEMMQQEWRSLAIMESIRKAEQENAAATN